MNINTNIENVVIIGGGPAGFAAAIYNARAGLHPLVIAGFPPGGQLMLTTEVENYPGFESILGPELIEKFRSHAKKFGTKVVDENVLEVNFSKKPFEITTSSKVYDSKSVIIATGAKALWLNLQNEQRLRGKGVSACATCDGFFFKNKTVAVVGGGDTAMEEALTLTKFANKVYIIHRRDQFRASKIMQDRVLKHEKIEVMWNTVITDVLGQNKVEGLVIASTSTSLSVNSAKQSQNEIASSPSVPRDDKVKNLKVDGLFLAIGHKPDTELFKDKIILDKKGYIVTKGSMTSVEGVFAGGDCVDHHYRQAGTAVGLGIAAAIDVEKWLEINN